MKQKSKEKAAGEPKAKIKKVSNDVTDQKEVTNDVDRKELKNKKSGDKSMKKGKFEKPLTKGEKGGKTNSLKKTNSKDASGKRLTSELKISSTGEKPDWLEIKKQRKELREKRRAKKLTHVYDISVKAAVIGEKLRKVKCPPEERKKLIKSAHTLLEGHYGKVIFAHDMSRVVQWLIKYGDMELKIAILNELKPVLVTMLQSKYAKNCLKIMMKYGSPEIRNDIIATCYGNVVKLMSHSVSAPLLDLFYSNWATDMQKIDFKQEFYGDMYKQAKDKNVKTLTDVFQTATGMKSATLTAVKGNLVRILNKELFTSPLVQCILLEFLNVCTSEDRNEMIAMLKNSIVELSKTKTGAKVAAICIWHGNNKDKKAIMKGLKENVKNIAMTEHGYLVLLALLDSVDDTVLMKKIILSEVLKDLVEIALNEHGKHVILYLVARRNSHYFPPSIVEYLKQGDGNEISKKPADIREKELLESVRDSLLESVISETESWLSSSSISMVTLAILKVGSGELLKRAFESISEYICNSESTIKDGDAESKVVEHAGLHMMLKKLIQNDKILQEQNECTFGEVLDNHLTTKVIQTWIEFNRGCFLIILLLENESKSTVNSLLTKLKPLSAVLKSQSSPGAKILLKKLK